MAALWALQVRIRDASHVDVAWAVLIARLTGIPATERQALRSRTDDAEYRRTTSVFVPLPPAVTRRARGGVDAS